VGVLPLLLATQLVLVADEEPPRAGDLVLFLAPAEPEGLDVRALLDAVAIYTRDLGARVQLLPELPPAPATTFRARALALLRARAARLAFWCAPGADNRSIGLRSLDAQGILRAEVVAGSGPEGPDLHRAIALKLRAILTGDESQAPPPAPDPAPPPAETAPAASSVQAVPAISVAEAHRPAPAARGLGLAVEYAVSSSPARAVQNGLALEGSFRAGRGLEVALAAGVALGPESSVPAGTLSLYDVPLRLGARYVRPGSRLAVGGGLYGTAHILAARASSPDGRRDGDVGAAGGAGIEALARSPGLGWLALELRLYAEALMPRTRFLVGGTPALETGVWTAGATMGVRFSTR
jgi:hypothetical protein